MLTVAAEQGVAPEPPKGCSHPSRSAARRGDVRRQAQANGSNEPPIVIARAGNLLEGHINTGASEWRELADFNSNKPEPKEAPRRAKVR